MLSIGFKIVFQKFAYLLGYSVDPNLNWRNLVTRESETVRHVHVDFTYTEGRARIDDAGHFLGVFFKAFLSRPEQAIKRILG